MKLYVDEFVTGVDSFYDRGCTRSTGEKFFVDDIWLFIGNLSFKKIPATFLFIQFVSTNGDKKRQN